MHAKIRDFVDVYKKKPVPAMSVEDFVKTHNHELWCKCQKCGAWEDLRKTFHCTECKSQLDPNLK